jgi:hypothetical protein
MAILEALLSHSEYASWDMGKLQRPNVWRSAAHRKGERELRKQAE